MSTYESSPKDATRLIHARLRAHLARRLDRVVARRSRDPNRTDPVTTSSVLREALARGLDAIEADEDGVRGGR